MADTDSAETLPVLGSFLNTDDTSVRLSAAYALVGQSSPGAADLNERALWLEYGGEEGESRKPEIQAALLRKLMLSFPDHPKTAQALSNPRKFKAPSVQFMALAASGREAEPTGEHCHRPL